jgi:predicted site-specific integrase-resolvase
VKKPQPKSIPSPLVDRYQAAEILNVSGMTVRRIEADGKLEPVKLREGRTSKTFYRKHEVYALAGVPMPAADAA